MTLCIAGAGGLGREVYDAALAAGATVSAFLDDRLAGTVVRGLAVLRIEDAPGGSSFVVGVADPVARKSLTDRLAPHLRLLSVVHPLAVIAPDIVLGNGCVVLAGAYVSSSVRLADGVHVHYNATVGHDTLLADRVSVYPGANVAGAVVLEEDVTIGSNATVLQGLRIGAGTIVGAGAVVTRDVAPGSVMVGVPARPRARP